MEEENREIKEEERSVGGEDSGSSNSGSDVSENKSEEVSQTENPRIDNEPDKKNPWVVSTLVLGIAVIVLLILMFNGGVTGGVIGVGSNGGINSDDASDKVVEYLNEMTGGGVEFISTEDLGDLYEVMVEFQEQEIPVYITKDGEYFVQGAVEIAAVEEMEEMEGEQPVAEPPKSDMPIVELFVMTHCPYGTQAEKGIIPVYELLGDKIEGNINFVHYFMHEPEETETPVQVCIREEQGDKYMDYLRCFLEEGIGEDCLSEVGIDEEMLNECIENNAEGYYEEDSILSEDYGVRGSPTLVINGEVVSSGRSPSAYLDIICSAFNEVPEECNEELSSETPAPMWGWEESGTDTEAQC